MEKFYRQSWIDINLDNLYSNLQQIKALFPAGIYVMAVVKADAYGHGILAVARFLESRMINYLGVASLDEAILLRRAGIRTPILILGEIQPKELPIAQFYGVTVTVASKYFAQHLRNYVVNNSDSAIKVHIKIDTGMHRLGLDLLEAEDVIAKLFISGLELEGIFSHFHSADTDPSATMIQIHRFAGLLRRLKTKGIEFKLRHISNSAGLLFHRSFEGLCNMVRPGIALYGAYPNGELMDYLRLSPVLSLKSKIIALRRLKKGQGLGYNYAYIAPKERLVAVVPVGYGDGYPRALSNRAKVLIKESRCPIIGRICMDQLFVDVTDLGDVSVGDEVVLIGRDGIETITVEELASWCNTISYEILCQLGRRLHRQYITKSSGLKIRQTSRKDLVKQEKSGSALRNIRTVKVFEDI